MSENLVATVLTIQGMTCASCERRIERRLAGVPGVSAAEVSYSEGTAHVTFQPGMTNADVIRAAVEELDYVVVAAGTVPCQPSVRQRMLFTGGTNLSQCISRQPGAAGVSTLRPTSMYNMGRVIS